MNNIFLENNIIQYWILKSSNISFDLLDNGYTNENEDVLVFTILKRYNIY